MYAEDIIELRKRIKNLGLMSDICSYTYIPIFSIAFSITIVLWFLLTLGNEPFKVFKVLIPFSNTIQKWCIILSIIFLVILVALAILSFVLNKKIRSIETELQDSYSASAEHYLQDDTDNMKGLLHLINSYSELKKFAESRTCSDKQRTKVSEFICLGLDIVSFLFLIVFVFMGNKIALWLAIAFQFCLLPAAITELIWVLVLPFPDKPHISTETIQRLIRKLEDFCATSTKDK